MANTTRNIQPIKINNNVRFSSIGGLDEHIKCLREMVLFPLMYPSFFKRFNTHPPKGVLFHGPPGTGKTLLARALANECGVVRGRKVSFFMRKGADIMDKYYGESEKLMKSIFTKASKMRPAIIFFDEIDALAPARTESNSEAYNSIVATLLAEMDGLNDRGEVIVIGATNRPDAIDPALRRPGRLDRELYFPPPNVIARREILGIYTEQWVPRPSNETLNYLAAITNGFLGSDIQALCSEAVLKALKREFPHIYDADPHRRDVIDTRNVIVTRKDMLAAKCAINPSGYRIIPMAAKDLSPHCEPLLKTQIDSAGLILDSALPKCDENSDQVDTTPGVFLICGECAETHIAPALLARLDACIIKEISMATIHSARVASQENAIISTFAECRRSDRKAVIFVRDILGVLESLEKSQGSTLLSQLWRTRAAGDRALLFATSNVGYHELPEEVQALFPLYKNCLYSVREPRRTEVLNFLLPVFDNLKESSEKPISFNKQDLFSRSSVGSFFENRVTNETSSSENSVPYAKPEKKRIEKKEIKQEHAPVLMGDCRKRRKDASFVDHNTSVKRPRMAKNCNWSPQKSECSRNTDSVRGHIDIEVTTKEETEKMVSDNVDLLCKLGLEALIDLYEQIKKAACSNGSVSARAREIGSITCRYLKMARSYS